MSWPTESQLFVACLRLPMRPELISHELRCRWTGALGTLHMPVRPESGRTPSYMFPWPGTVVGKR